MTTIQGDLVGVLVNANLRANADYEPEDTAGDYIVVLRKSKEPTMTLLGAVGWPVKSTFSLICKSADKAGAAALAVAAAAAIAASTVITSKFFEPVDEDEFEPETMENAEVVNVSIWH